MKILIFFSLISFNTWALDPSRLINELNYLRDSSSLVKELETSTEEMAQNSSKDSSLAPLDNAEIINIEAEYFTDEISTKRAAPKRSR